MKSHSLFPGPAAGFDDPLEILDACHERVQRFGTLVERIERHVGERGADPEAREAARSVMRYFDDAGANHHRDEEQDLFPALRRRIAPERRPALEALIARILEEHAALFSRWTAVRAKLARIAAGEPAAFDPGEAEAFALAYRRHIQLEESELFPLAREVLGAEDIRVLGQAMARRREAPH